MNSNDIKKNRKALPDPQIVDLYWKRDEQAIDETDFKYRNYLYTIATNILNNSLDSEECLNDTYLGTWNAIPPERPSPLQVFLSKIMRNTALVRYRKNNAEKRVPSEMTVSLDELEKYIPYDKQTPSAEEDYYIYQLSCSLNDFLKTLPKRQCLIFICRYYCCDRISEIARILSISERSVYRELEDVKEKLKKHLEKEGYFNA
ncbi:MAG: sigma-70 family RNA polymerase sigma factor [Clostridia bacterium]|nr:sigma-70 family RNA polymerase sigma factor [Clostridia bacterium]